MKPTSDSLVEDTFESAEVLTLMDFPERLATLRKKRGMTQHVLENLS